MRRSVAGLVVGVLVATGAVLAVGLVPAGAGGFDLSIDAVVNGTPNASGLQVKRSCDGLPGDATSSVFTATQTDVIPAQFLNLGVTCTVSVIQDGGMVASFKCETSGQLPPTCLSDRSIKRTTAPEFGTATITVTFDPAPTTTPAAAAVETPIDFTG